MWSGRGLGREQRGPISLARTSPGASDPGEALVEGQLDSTVDVRWSLCAMDTADLSPAACAVAAHGKLSLVPPFFSYRDPFDTENQAWGRVGVRDSLTMVGGPLQATSAGSPVSTLCLQVSLSTGLHTRTLVNTTQDLTEQCILPFAVFVSVIVVFSPLNPSCSHRTKPFSTLEHYSSL